MFKSFNLISIILIVDFSLYMDTKSSERVISVRCVTVLLQKPDLCWLQLIKFKRITFIFHPSEEQTAFIDVSSPYLLTVRRRFHFPPVNLVCVVLFRPGLILLLSVFAANAAPVLNKLGRGGGCRSLHHCLTCSGQHFVHKCGWRRTVLRCNEESTNDLVCTWVLCSVCWICLIALQGQMEPNWNRV